jgi:hypothetical protein
VPIRINALAVPPPISSQFGPSFADYFFEPDFFDFARTSDAFPELEDRWPADRDPPVADSPSSLL